MVSYNQFSFPC